MQTFPNAPERLYGADGLFQISVLDEFGNVLRSKGLPFQAKTDWKGKNSEIARQSRDIQSSLGAGIVVNYRKAGYQACTTSIAAAAGGNRLEVERQGALGPLGQALGRDFLDCRIGRVGLYFDPATERFRSGVESLPPANAITTTVRRRRGAA